VSGLLGCGGVGAIGQQPSHQLPKPIGQQAAAQLPAFYIIVPANTLQGAKPQRLDTVGEVGRPAPFSQLPKPISQQAADQLPQPILQQPAAKLPGFYIIAALAMTRSSSSLGQQWRYWGCKWK
jgi:hypothetical protein